MVSLLVALAAPMVAAGQYMSYSPRDLYAAYAPYAPVYTAPVYTYQQAPVYTYQQAPVYTYQQAPVATTYQQAPAATTYQQAPVATTYQQAPVATYPQAPPQVPQVTYESVYTMTYSQPIPTVYTSQVPVPQAPVPQAPAPQEPAPQEPAPQVPAPQVPAPQVPAPQVPAPQVPAPQAPAPQAPAPQAPSLPAPAPAPVPVISEALLAEMREDNRQRVQSSIDKHKDNAKITAISGAMEKKQSIQSTIKADLDANIAKIDGQIQEAQTDMERRTAAWKEDKERLQKKAEDDQKAQFAEVDQFLLAQLANINKEGTEQIEAATQQAMLRLLSMTQ